MNENSDKLKNDGQPSPIAQESPWPAWRRRETDEALEKELQYLREALSSNPFYARQAARMEALTGDPMAYWREHYGNRRYTRRPPPVANALEGEVPLQGGTGDGDDEGQTTPSRTTP